MAEGHIVPWTSAGGSPCCCDNDCPYSPPPEGWASVQLTESQYNTLFLSSAVFRAYHAVSADFDFSATLPTIFTPTPIALSGSVSKGASDMYVGMKAVESCGVSGLTNGDLEYFPVGNISPPAPIFLGFDLDNPTCGTLMTFDLQLWKSGPFPYGMNVLIDFKTLSATAVASWYVWPSVYHAGPRFSYAIKTKSGGSAEIFFYIGADPIPVSVPAEIITSTTEYPPGMYGGKTNASFSVIIPPKITAILPP